MFKTWTTCDESMKSVSLRLTSSTGCQRVKHGPRTILLKLLKILLSGSPFLWWTRRQGPAGLIRQQSQLRRLTLHARHRFRVTNARTVELAGINQFQMFATVSTKKNLTSQQKRSRAAVDYSSCVCKSGDEAARGSLPAQRPHSDQVISGVVSSSRAAGTRAPDPGLKQVNTIIWFFQDHKWKQRHASVKRQAPSVKHQAPIFIKLSNQPG